MQKHHLILIVKGLINLNLPLFDSIEVKKYARPLLPRYTTYRNSDSFNIYIFYYSGLEKRKVVRRIEIRRYKNILRLIPEDIKYEWITK